MTRANRLRFCYELLNSNPYTFLDGGEAQERRARAVSTRRSLSVESVQDLARLDPQAIQQVRDEVKPTVRDFDELHDVLLGRIVLFDPDVAPEWQPFLDQLGEQKRIARFESSEHQLGWVAAERLPAARAAFPEATVVPELEVPQGVQMEWEAIDARVAVIRGIVETCGPTNAQRLAKQTGISEAQTFACLESLEGEGIVMRGRFDDTLDNPSGFR